MDTSIALPQPFSITSDLPPARANARGRTFVWNHLKRKFWAVLDARLAVGDIVLPAEPIKYFRLEYVYRVKRLGDHDGRLYNGKSLLDWLKGKAIVDDSPIYAYWPTLRQIVDTRGEPSLTLTVWPMAEAPVVEKIEYTKEEAKRLRDLSRERLAATRAVKKAKADKKAERVAKAAEKAVALANRKAERTAKATAKAAVKAAA